MSKFDSLWKYIESSGRDELILDFSQIREITGNDIDHSFLTYKKELMSYGYSVKKISMKNRLVLFQKLPE